MEQMLNKLDLSPNPELDREIAKDVGGAGFLGMLSICAWLSKIVNNALLKVAPTR